MFDAKRAREFARRLDQAALGRGVVRCRPAIHAERQRNEGVAEQAALDFGERQDADDPPAPLRDAVVAAMAKDLLDDLAPADAMKETRVRATVDEVFPALRVRGDERTHGDVVRREFAAVV